MGHYYAVYNHRTKTIVAKLSSRADQLGWLNDWGEVGDETINSADGKTWHLGNSGREVKPLGYTPR